MNDFVIMLSKSFFYSEDLGATRYLEHATKYDMLDSNLYNILTSDDHNPTDMRAVKVCDICGALAPSETHNHDLRLGDRCEICDRWLCQECNVSDDTHYDLCRDCRSGTRSLTHKIITKLTEVYARHQPDDMQVQMSQACMDKVIEEIKDSPIHPILGRTTTLKKLGDFDVMVIDMEEDYQIAALFSGGKVEVVNSNKESNV